MLTENLHLVTFMNVGNVRHVNHGNIHADIAHVWCLLTIYQTIAGTTSQMAVQSISIADRYGSNETVARQDTLTTIAHRFLLRYISQLKDGGLER